MPNLFEPSERTRKLEKEYEHPKDPNWVSIPKELVTTKLLIHVQRRTNGGAIIDQEGNLHFPKGCVDLGENLEWI